MVHVWRGHNKVIAPLYQMKLCLLLFTTTTLFAAGHCQPNSGNAGNSNLTNVDFSNSTIWQAIERLSNATSSMTNGTASTGSDGSVASIQLIKNAFERQPSLVQLVNQTQSEQQYIVFLPIDSAISRYNLRSQFNSSSGTTETGQNLTLPLLSRPASTNGTSTSGNITAPGNLTFNISMQDLLSYHIGNLTDLYAQKSLLVFPPSLLASENFPISANSSVSGNSTMLGLFDNNVTGVATVPTLLNSTDFYSSSGGEGPIKGQVLTLNQTCILPGSQSRSALYKLGSFFRKSSFSSKANDDASAPPLYVNHGLLAPPIQVLSSSEARARGSMSNFTVQNGVIYLIDGLLVPPSNISTIGTFYNRTTSNSTESQQDSSAQRNPPALGKFFMYLNQTAFAPMLDNMTAVTIFALNDETLDSLSIPSQASNVTSINSTGQFNASSLSAFDRLFAEQIFNGTSAYYASHLMNLGNSSRVQGEHSSSYSGEAFGKLQEGPSSESRNLTNLLGGSVNVTLLDYNNTQLMPVIYLNDTSRVIQQDLLLKNGVVHVVDEFFNSTGTTRESNVAAPMASDASRLTSFGW